MKYIKALVLIITVMAFSMIIAGCSGDSNSDGENEFMLYYTNETGTKLQGIEYSVQGGTVEASVYEVLGEMCKPQKNVNTAIPSGVGIISYSYSKENEYVSVNFDSAYNELDSVTEVFLRAAVVLTLTQIDGVEYVGFRVNDQPIKDSNGEAVGIMKASNFIDKVGNTVNNYESATITLYFANIKGNGLRTEIRTGMYDSSKTLERYIVDQLIAGPSVEGNYKTMTTNLSVISVRTSNGVCYIDFDENFIQSSSPVKDEIMIYSIVNSLTELSYISKVQISVAGEVDVKLHNSLSLDTLFVRDLSYMEQ